MFRTYGCYRVNKTLADGAESILNLNCWIPPGYPLPELKVEATPTPILNIETIIKCLYENINQNGILFSVNVDESDWDVDETIYLLKLANAYDLNWFAMADSYSYLNCKKRTPTEIKYRMRYVFQKVPSLKQYDHGSLSLSSPRNGFQEGIELITLGRCIDSSLQSIIDSRNRLFKKFAGDLLALPKTFLANASLPFWPHTPQPSTLNQTPSHKPSRKKISSILSSNIISPTILKNTLSVSKKGSITQPVTNLNILSIPKKPISSAVSNVKSLPPKDKPMQNSSHIPSVYIRSQRLKTIRVGIVKTIEKQLFEKGIGMRPSVATQEICSLHDELRILYMALYDERKSLEKVELACKSANIPF